MNRFLFLIALFFLIVSHKSNGQIFIGSGLADVSEFGGGSVLDDGTGFTFQLEKDLNLSKSGRLKMHPNINISFLYSNVDRQGFPNYFNAISLSPKVSYEIISKEKWKVAPFANPFTSYLIGLESEIFGVLSESFPIDTFKWGFEGGLRVDFIVGTTTIRLVPLSIQSSIDDYYAQLMVSLLVSI